MKTLTVVRVAEMALKRERECETLHQEVSTAIVSLSVNRAVSLPAASFAAMGDYQAWEALDAMMNKPAEPPATAPKSSYGRDAPVTVTGPSPGMIGPAKKAAPKKAAKKAA
jgi:hypothetical protein